MTTPIQPDDEPREPEPELPVPDPDRSAGDPADEPVDIQPASVRHANTSTEG